MRMSRRGSKTNALKGNLNFRSTLRDFQEKNSLTLNELESLQINYNDGLPQDERNCFRLMNIEEQPHMESRKNLFEDTRDILIPSREELGTFEDLNKIPDFTNDGGGGGVSPPIFYKEEIQDNNENDNFLSFVRRKNRSKSGMTLIQNEMFSDGRRATERPEQFKEGATNARIFPRGGKEIEEPLEAEKGYLGYQEERKQTVVKTQKITNKYSGTTQKRIMCSNMDPEKEEVCEDNKTRKTNISFTMTKLKPPSQIDLFDRSFDIAFQSNNYFPSNNKAVVLEKLRSLKRDCV